MELVRTSGATGIGLDPVNRLAERARTAVAEAGLTERIEIVEASMQNVPFPNSSFDLVWCRDAITVVDDLDAGVREMVRVLRPGGHFIACTVFATDRLEPKEAELLAQSLANVADNLIEANVEASFQRSGLDLAGCRLLSPRLRCRRSTGGRR
jgi:ubiquinone/menaquinone biosynthesis C-methylase UbiE